MNSAAANRIFGSPRVPINTASRPDWARLAKQLRMWKSEDRQAGGPIESYGRYLEWSRAASPDDDDLGRAVAFFTARTASPPDEPLWRTLCAAAARPCAPNPYDLALAWAAGWRGDRQRPPFTPGRVGELAVLALVEQVQAALLASIRLLAAQTGLAIVTPDETASMAAAMGMSLLGVCDSGHHPRRCGGTCGGTCCFADHDIRTWDPATCHLRPFVDQAVRGTAQKRILGGAFASSMMFRLLEAEGRVLCRTVEWGRCEVCGRAFEGSRCPAPHRPAVAPSRREPRKNQIIVPAVGAADGYVPMQRWWCAACCHLYGSAASARRRSATCPRCGSASSTSKAVWTLATTPRVTEAV
jgi:hypothetical protein